ncbi:MAG: hypothetical protein FWC64_03940 [Treponema sp.]|nr:hypothetical protein [Treponema sp.]
MAIVRYTAGRELTPEEDAAFRAQIREAAKRPYTHDPDCPLLTEKQLAEFRPVNFASIEERTRHMEASGLMKPEKIPAEALPV